jgi:hypothetical protein
MNRARVHGSSSHDLSVMNRQAHEIDKGEPLGYPNIGYVPGHAFERVTYHEPPMIAQILQL